MSDFFDEFDEVTLLKLDVFRGYIREWLAVFLTEKHYNNIAIFDYFSGKGQDKHNHPGTPLIILEELFSYYKANSSKLNSYVGINLFFNDKDTNSIQELEKLVNEKMNELDLNSKYQIRKTFKKKDFSEALKETYRFLYNERIPCLALMDQFGINQVTESNFKELIAAQKTDIIFFISSSTLARFPEHEAILRHFSKVKEYQSDDPRNIHNRILEMFRDMVPADQEYFLAPFTLKRGGNYNGLIFGSNHLLGLQKFLKICWDLDNNAGEGNANSYHDIQTTKDQMLIPGMEIPNKIAMFEEMLWEYLSTPKTNYQIYEYSLLNGFLSSHINQVLKKFQEEGKINVITNKPLKKGFFRINQDLYKRIDEEVKIERRS
ncbi:MAG: three-Cys-motif partner protein TcmP [Thermoguttaceae bacterium]|nr:three-Cys-motif partner protein TcmP [Thermoguttaceae bacterium]